MFNLICDLIHTLINSIDYNIIKINTKKDLIQSLAIKIHIRIKIHIPYIDKVTNKIKIIIKIIK